MKRSPSKIIKKIILEGGVQCLIHHSPGETQLDIIIKSLVSNYSRVANFFGFKIPCVRLILVYTRKEMDFLASRRTPNWLIAYTDSTNKIILFTPAVIEQESSHQSSDFQQTLCHEVVHLFVYNIRRSCEPVWLNEGLACLIADQMERFKKLSIVDNFQHKTFFLLDTKKKWEKLILKKPGMPYMLSYLLVDFLISRFGKHNFISLLSSLNKKYTQKDFYQKVREIYDKDVNDIANEFFNIKK